MDLETELTAIERLLWTNDPDLYRDNLMENAMLVFAETGPIGRDTAVEAIRRENTEGRHWAEVAFDDVRAVELTRDVALLSYRVRSRWAPDAVEIAALASSVYVRGDGRWKLAFHQQTPMP